MKIIKKALKTMYIHYTKFYKSPFVRGTEHEWKTAKKIKNVIND